MNTAFVNIWGELVGAVAWNARTGVADFEYNPAFKKQQWDLSPLKMPISEPRRIISFPELRANKGTEYHTFRGLPGLLADVLPDRYGNQLINMWLSQQGRSLNDMNPVELLCFIGSRGMGALEFQPATMEHQSAVSLEVKSLVETAQKLLSNKKTVSTNFHEKEKAIMDVLKVGTSAGGARPKAVIAFNEKTGSVKSGQTHSPIGFEHWLIKLDGITNAQLGASKGYGRVEMAYYNMAVACGIEMMPSRLLEENGRAHFMTKRFDREGPNIKHHVQTFCAMKHFDFNLINSFSYEQLFQTMRELKLNYQDMEQMYRRMVFNVIARNCDDHTKNFSFLLKKNQSWELAPAYDICHAYRPESDWVSQHALSINQKRSNITKQDLLLVGKLVAVKKAASIIDEINETVSQWKSFAKAVDVDSRLINQIAKTLWLL